MTESPSIQPGKRVTLVGRTGSGKSSLARYLLLSSPGQWVILNPKGTAAYNSLPDLETIHGLDYAKIEAAIFAKRKDKKAKFRFINVIPKPSEANMQEMDEFILWLHENFTRLGLVCDELYTLHKSGRAGDGVIAWLTRGRELKQSFLGLTQRPAWVSAFLFSESDFIAEMSLNIEVDRKKVFDITGQKIMLTKLPAYEWLWYDAAADTVRWFNPVKIN